MLILSVIYYVYIFSHIFILRNLIIFSTSQSFPSFYIDLDIVFFPGVLPLGRLLQPIFDCQCLVSTCSLTYLCKIFDIFFLFFLCSKKCFFFSLSLLADDSSSWHKYVLFNNHGNCCVRFFLPPSALHISLFQFSQMQSCWFWSSLSSKVFRSYKYVVWYCFSIYT